MTISSKIIKDSMSEAGSRLTTYILTYPRFIHSELMTHRAFSRNASSSRAIPFKKQVEMIKKDMAMPIAFLSNKPGMQGGSRLPKRKEKWAFRVWRAAGYTAIGFAILLDKLGAHKQYVNRLIEPFSHITVVLSGTEDAFANFFALRFHPAAQPEIAMLAEKMHLNYVMSSPVRLKKGKWHLPFVDDVNPNEMADDFDWTPLIVRSVAACARVSYNNHDGTSTSPEKDKALYDKLLAEQPIHASPAEHQGCSLGKWDQGLKSGNFLGWLQYRKLLKNEYITKFTKPLKSFK